MIFGSQMKGLNIVLCSVKNKKLENYKDYFMKEDMEYKAYIN